MTAKKKPPMGRPRFKAGVLRSVHFSMQMSVAERQALQAHADRAGQTASFMVIEAMRAAGLFKKPRKRPAR